MTIFGWFPATLLGLFALSPVARGQSIYTPYTVTTFAGYPVAGSVDGTGAAARFQSPRGMTIDQAGNLYVADVNNRTIRKITPAAAVTTYAGIAGSQPDFADAINGAARFGNVMWVAADQSGTLYTVEDGGIRKISPDRTVTTFFRTGGGAGIAAGADGHVYCIVGNSIQKISPQGVSTLFAGHVNQLGTVDATGPSARFWNPSGLAMDDAGTLYVADEGAHTIRKVSREGVVTTLAGVVGKYGTADGIGANAQFRQPRGIAVDRAGNVYVVENYDHIIRRITADGVVTTIAGLAGKGSDVLPSGSPIDGVGSKARFDHPFGITVDSTGNVFVADDHNTRIRKCTPSPAAPAMTLQPLAQAGAEGRTVRLEAGATGAPTPTFEWFKDGVKVAGAIGRTLVLSNLKPENTGTYTVVATNPFGSVTSDAAAVVIGRIPPSVVWNPVNQIAAGTALGERQMGARASVAGSFSYDFVPGTALTAGNYVLQATFTPADGETYSPVVVSRDLVVIPARPGSFNSAAYLAGNADVAALIGDATDKFDQAWIHYYQYGIAEGRTDGDFDVQAYLAQYPNTGATPQAAALYWYTTGRKNGDRIPAGFSVAGYFLRNSDVAATFANDKYGAWLHYYNYGIFEGRSYDANFIVDEYLELNPDLKTSFGANKQAALMHWLTYGHPLEDRMGRVPVGFNVDSYLARYPDLQAVFSGIAPVAVRNVTVWNHYIAYGTLEGRSDGDFEAYNYLATNPDLAAEFGTDVRAAAFHWYFYGRREGRRIPGGFDVADYRARYPDIGVGLGDDLYGSWLHYRDTGVNEGRVFGQIFRPADYLALNPDVAAVIGTNHRDALLHWLFYGQFEARPAKF